MSDEPRLKEVFSLWLQRVQDGTEPSVEELCGEFPGLAADLQIQIEAFHTRSQLEKAGSGSQYAETISEERPSSEGASTAPQLPPCHPPLAQKKSASLPTVPGYELLSVLGKGGMGVVYKARDARLKRVVALKMILNTHGDDSEQLVRFRVEAEAVARLQHPNIVQIYEIGEHKGVWFISLEYLDGGTLSQKAGGQALPPVEAARIVETLARGMHHAHERGIVHRDLKPMNVLLALDGTLKIADFGLAKQIEGDSGQTRTGAVMGTPSYMAPEQAFGQVDKIGPLTDVFALGTILYELLTGSTPFKGASVLDTLEQVRSKEAAPPRKRNPAVPRDLETICLKAIAKAQEERYASALALANDLARFLAEEPILARRESLPRRSLRVVKRHRWKVALAVVLFLGLGLGTALVISAQRASEISRLETDLLQLMDADEWSQERLRQIDPLLARLEEMTPEKGGELRAKANERFAKAIEKRILRPVLEEEDFPEIEQLISSLKERDEKASAELAQHLESRTQRWQTVANLAPPIKSLGDLFAPSSVVVADGVIQLRPAKGSEQSVVFSQAPSKGNVELKARFDSPGWESGGPVGLVLHGGTDRGYSFLAEKTEVKNVVEGTSTAHSLLRVRILRHRVVLREAELPYAEGALTLRARREGARLTFQVNGLEPVHFVDHFPLPLEEAGVFGLIGKKGTKVLALQAQRLTMSLAPSAFEKGDILFGDKKFEEALEFYRKQALTATDGEVGLEARFKEGLCLLELKHADDALAVFRELSTSKNERWAVLGCCHLWLLYLDRKELLEAQAVQERLITMGLKDAYLGGLLPEDLRTRMQGRARSTVKTFFTSFDDKHVVETRRLFELRRLLVNPADGPALRLDTARQLWMAGREDLAGQAFDEILASATELDFVTVKAIEGRSWIHLYQREPESSITLLNYWLKRAADPTRHAGVRASLLCQRARTFAAMKNFSQAEQDIQLALPDARASGWYNFTEWHLIQGFLRLDQGDEKGALLAWREGRKIGGAVYVRDTSWPLVYSFLLAALTDDLSDTEITQVRSRLAALVAGESKSSSWVDTAFALQPLSVYREMWRTPKGKEIARRLVMRDCSYLEAGRLPSYLMVAETLRQANFPQATSPIQEEIIWDTVRIAHVDYLAGKFKSEHFLPLGLTVQGNTLLWPGLRDAFEPPMRANVSYLFGIRYLRLGEQKERKEAERDGYFRQAADFFQTAVASAAADSRVGQEAREELKRLKMK